MTKRPVVQRKGELPRKYLPQFINILKKLCKLVLLQCYIFFFLHYLEEGGGGIIVHQMPLSNEELPFSQCHQGSETKPMS